jgi:sugar phosphate isomerase/epimerase
MVGGPDRDGTDAPEAWRDMLDSLEAALTVAEAHDVTLGFEPEHNNVTGRGYMSEAAGAVLDRADERWAWPPKPSTARRGSRVSRRRPGRRR